MADQGLRHDDDDDDDGDDDDDDDDDDGDEFWDVFLKLPRY